MDAQQIKELLRTRHNTPDWIYVTEVKTATGSVQDYARSSISSGRYIDAFAMNLWPSNKFWRVAYEIKVSRSDFISELSDPQKRSQAVLLSNEFYFVLAPNIFKREDIINYSLFDEGIIEISDNGDIKKHHQARKRSAFPMPIWFTASLMRCVREESWGKQEFDSSVKQFELIDGWTHRTSSPE